MKKPLVTLALTLLLLSAGFLACQKYASTTNSNTNINPFPAEVMVTASVQGRVVDQNGIPVQGAMVTSGVASTSTDINGLFTFTNISLSSRFGYVKATKSGYFAGSRSIVTSGGQSSFISIQLTPRTETGNFPASSGGKIMVYSGDTVSFAASSLVNAATNAAYTGTVHVFATYLNPTNDSLTRYMPGDLRGITTAGQEVPLQTYGMMSVELQDDAGNKLQIASGQQATITMAIPTALQGTAPATIPLWYFNDSTGRWIEQGSATRQGNNYVGNVGHFTWWNCDVFYKPQLFKAHIKGKTGNPVPYADVELLYRNMSMFGGYTDSSGFVQGWLPAGVSCQLEIYTECRTALAGVNVGPALADVDLGTVTIDDTESDLTLTGTVLDCFNNPVASGFVNTYIDGLNYRAGVTNGKFTLPIHRCFSGNAPAQITAGDLGTAQQGSVATIAVSSAAVDAGNLSACGVSVNQYLTITVSGTTYNQTTSNYLPYSSGNFTCGNPDMHFTIAGLSATGTYNPTNFHLLAGSHTYGPAGPTSLQCTISSFGAVNQFITGSLSGNVYDSTAKAVAPLTGTFRYLRTN